MYRKNLQGFFLIIVGTFFWSTTPIFGKLIVASFDPISTIIIRLFLAFFFLTNVLLLKRPKMHLVGWDFPLMVLNGLFGVAIFQGSFFLSLERISASMTIVLLYLSPLVVLIASFFLFQERLSKIRFLAILLTLLGLALVVEVYDILAFQLRWDGILFGLLAAVTYAFFTLLSKYLLRRFHPLVIIWYGLGFGLFFLFIFRHPKTLFITTISQEVFFFILYLAIFPTLVAYFLYMKGLELMEASQASLITTLEPVFTIMLAYGILKEQLSFGQLVGTVFILGSVLIIVMDWKGGEGLFQQESI